MPFPLGLREFYYCVKLKKPNIDLELTNIGKVGIHLLSIYRPELDG
jgi:hypothetical protein